LQQIGTGGADIATFMALGFANPVAAGFAADLFISSFAFWLYMFAAGNNSPKPWVFILLNLAIGLSCALPAYFYWRARRPAAAVA
ncbi:MAG: DUF2834 domain-containing protein, partial [Gammaproteobacteria bacterium]|nr:DUF2834 domain-containing protein [Gammaproteobacteria bacterium]